MINNGRTSRDPPHGRVTISELFPFYKNAQKWGKLTEKEDVRLVKEYTICTVTPQSIKYTVDGKDHRIDGPAYIMYFRNGKIYNLQWMYHDLLHRIDGPASIVYWSEGIKFYEQWFIHGIFTKIIEYDSYGNERIPGRIQM